MSERVVVTRVNDMTYTVRVPGRRVKTFRGETAWCDSERYAYDTLVAEGRFFERPTINA